MTLEHSVFSPSASTATPARGERPDGDGWERVNPTLALFLQLDDLNITLGDVLAELRVAPEGIMLPVSGVQTGTPPGIEVFALPLFGFTLTNDGPADLQFDVGAWQQWCTLKAGESIQTDMRKPKIERIAFQCAPGQSAAWRLTGVR